jgi:hypothetical protein
MKEATSVQQSSSINQCDQHSAKQQQKARPEGAGKAGQQGRLHYLW